ncbi:MAG: hypothetical protein HC927_05560 [Deltaproteobacteria bacterium]|nr:hypothetical protein [Deltaproteobacteria bacterium]
MPREEGVILFDCRDPYVARRFILDHEVNVIRAAIVSHLDLDHIGGLLPFLRQHFESGRRVERLYIRLDRRPEGRHLRDLVAQAIAWQDQPPHPGFVVQDPSRDMAGTRVVAEGDDWRVELLLPFHHRNLGSELAGGADPNERSAVLRVSRGDSAIVIGGDAPPVVWADVETDLRRARVIRVPHHGGYLDVGPSWASLSDFYADVGADLGLISVGTNNHYGHPLPDHVAALRRGGACRVLCTQLTARCHDSPMDERDRVLSTVVNGVEYPYRHRLAAGDRRRYRPSREVPCAGSITIWINADGVIEVEPAPRQQHDQFIDRLDHPLCRG